MGEDALQSLLLLSLRAGLYTCFCSFLFQFSKKWNIDCGGIITRWGAKREKSKKPL